jgi:hypothetical protein
MTHTHPAPDHADLPFAVPARWRRVAGTATFRSPAGDAPATLTIDRLHRPPAPVARRDVDDEDRYEIGAGPAAYTRFGRLDGDRPMVVERWVWEVPDGYLVLTGSAAWDDFPGYSDTFEAVAATFRG